MSPSIPQRQPRLLPFFFQDCRAAGFSEPLSFENFFFFPRKTFFYARPPLFFIRKKVGHFSFLCVSILFDWIFFLLRQLLEDYHPAISLSHVLGVLLPGVGEQSLFQHVSSSTFFFVQGLSIAGGAPPGPPSPDFRPFNSPLLSPTRNRLQHTKGAEVHETAFLLADHFLWPSHDGILRHGFVIRFSRKSAYAGSSEISFWRFFCFAPWARFFPPCKPEGPSFLLGNFFRPPPIRTHTTFG